MAGRIGPSWSEWFDGLHVRPDAVGATTLCGALRDQAELYAVLERIQELGLELLSVERLDARDIGRSA